MKKLLLTVASLVALSAVSHAQVIYSEDFELTTGTSLPAGFTQTVAVGMPNDSVGWNSGINTTLGSTDFSPNAHTRFVAVNDDKKQFANNTNSLLKTGTFALPVGSTPYLSFACSYLDRTYMSISEEATVEVSLDGGTIWTVVTTLTGNTNFWWEPRYISLAAYAGSPSVMLGFRYKDNTGWMYGFAVDDISVFIPPAADLELVGIAPVTGSPASYATGGSNITVTGGVFNHGASTVTSFDVKYVFNGGATVTNTITGVSIAPFSTGTFTATTPVTMPTAIGPYPLQVWVSLAGDANTLNDSAALDTLNTVGFMPTKKIVFEEGTGTWCQWCPRGAVFMDSLAKLYGNAVSLVAVHNSASDPMTLPAYDAYVSANIGGYPSVLVDRRFETDPGNLLAMYTQHSTDFAFADVTAVGTLTGTNLTVAVGVKPALNLNGAKLALVITEDDVHGTSSGYAQSNAYNGNPTPMSVNGFSFNTAGNPVPAANMHYDHVARSIDPSVGGGSGLVPASMVASTNYTYTFTKALSTTWNRNKLHAVVMLIDGANGAILNSQAITVTTGISDLTAGIENAVVYPNPATTEATVVFDVQNSTNVSISVYDMLGRVVYTAPAAQVAKGTGNVSIPLGGMAPGLYNVKIQTENGAVTTKLNVAK
ncbi:MAG: T9SS type A sorting domain-containing protein [Bacteroidota bacterium]